MRNNEVKERKEVVIGKLFELFTSKQIEYLYNLFTIFIPCLILFIAGPDPRK